MKLMLDKYSLGDGPSGLEIYVKGFAGDPSCDEAEVCQIFIEIHAGKLWVHVWNGSSQDPQSLVIDPV